MPTLTVNGGMLMPQETIMQENRTITPLFMIAAQGLLIMACGGGVGGSDNSNQPGIVNTDFMVPDSINATGAVDVTADLNAWFATVPNGASATQHSRAICKQGAVYRLNQGIQFQNRSHLTLEGTGCKLQLDPSAGFGQLQSLIILGHNYGGFWGETNTDIVIHGFELEASNPTPGAYNPSREFQAGVECENSDTVEIYEILVHGVGGDGVKIGASTGVHIHDIVVRDAGRMGVTVTSGSNILIENSVFTDMGYFVLDVEPNLDTESATGITFRNNTAREWGPDVGYGAGFVACGCGTAYQSIGDITIAGNTLTGSSNASLRSYFNQNQHRRLYNIVYTNNSATAADGAETGFVLQFKSVDGLTVTGNTQPLSGTSVLVSTTDSTNAVTSPNP